MNGQQFFYKVPLFVLVDVWGSDRESFIGHSGKLLCLRPKVSCVCEHAMCFRDKLPADLSKGVWNLALQPQQIYLH